MIAPAVRIYYVAHPIAAPSREEVLANARAAEEWRSVLSRLFPRDVFVAPYVGPILCGTEDEFRPGDRARGLAAARALIMRLNGLVAVGPRVSRGMVTEAEVATTIYDVVGLDLDGIRAFPVPAHATIASLWSSRIVSVDALDDRYASARGEG